MSAFIVTDAHINFIVNFAAAAFPRWCEHSLPANARLSDPEDMGHILYRANVASVNYRYAHHEPHPETGYQWKPPKPADKCVTVENIAKFLKALDCLDYQSCERPDWRESEVNRLIVNLRGFAIAKLPGYEQAPWGIDA